MWLVAFLPYLHGFAWLGDGLGMRKYECMLMLRIA